MRIAADIKPIGHVSPYRHIDPRYPGRRAIITEEDVHNGERVPDAAIYRYDPYRAAFILKDGV